MRNFWSRFFDSLRVSAPFAVMTALALAMAWWFGGQLNQLSGAISLTILIAGFAAGLMLVAYLLLRWRARLLLANLQQQATLSAADLRKRMQSEDGPLNRQDLLALGDAFARLVPKGMRVIALTMALGFAMTVSLQILALANAAVMYLQAKRLEDQNLLLAEQNRKLDYEFLREWSAVRETLVTKLSAPTDLVAKLESDLLSPLGILPDALANIWNVAVDGDGAPRLCQDQPYSCADMTLGDLRRMAMAGAIRVTSENISEITAFHALFRYAEGMFFVLTDGDTDNAQAKIDEVSYALKTGAGTCDSLFGLSAEQLWRGVANVGYGATQAWPVHDFTPGQVIELPQPTDRANFGMFGAALGMTMQALSDSRDPDSLTAAQVGKVLADGVAKLNADTKALTADCQIARDVAGQAFEALAAKNHEILDAMTAWQAGGIGGSTQPADTLSQ